jgi:L-iditol 2-dehydrogenase
MLAEKKVDVTSIISAAAPLCDGEEYFGRLKAKEKGLLKVVLMP